MCYHARTTFCYTTYVLYNCKDNTNRGVNIQITMRILPDMTVRVFLGDEILPNSELNWALSHTNEIILFWSQLDNLLVRYGGNITYINNDSRIKMISKSIQQIDANTVEQQQILQFLAEQLELVYAAEDSRQIC